MGTKRRKLPTFTAKDVTSWGPCQDGPMDYTRDGIAKLFGRRKYGNALLALKHPKVPDKDKMWLVMRLQALPRKLMVQIACDCAFHVLRLYERKNPGDKRPREAIQLTRLWIRGRAEIETVFAAADAAYAAAYAAADAACAAYAAAYAAYAAAEAAYAAYAAAYAAADAAADADAQKEESAWQTKQAIKRIVEWLEGGGGE